MPRSFGTTNLAPYSSAPAVGLTGDGYYDTTRKQLFLSDGTAWSPARAQAVGTTITGAVTTVAGTAYTINLAASLGNVAITLPSAPAQGSVISFVRADANVFTSFSLITPGGADVIGDTSPYNLVMRNAVVSFTYVGTTWYPAMPVTGASGMGGATPSSAFAPTIMSRDSAGRSQVVDPSVAQDIATKNYVDTNAPIVLATLAAPAATSGTVDTKIFSATVAANRVVVGDVFRIALHGISSSTGTLIFRVHAGAAGTTADATVWTSLTSAAQVANQRGGFDGMLTVRSATTVQCECLGYAQAALLPTVVAAVATSAIVSTATWFVTVSVTCSVGTFTAQQGSIEWL